MRGPVCSGRGEVSEWLKEHAWKVCKRLNRASGVRIPLSPPVTSRSIQSAVLWWPRRPLATLGRKPRQGRKAATVSIDAGAEASWRGHRHFFSRLSRKQPAIHQRWPVATGQPLRQRPYLPGAVENPARAGRQQRYRSTRVPRSVGGAIAFSNDSHWKSQGLPCKPWDQRRAPCAAAAIASLTYR